ncbi:MAG: hypothetical protein AAFQ82_06955 [Myxococcota bacterium]
MELLDGSTLERTRISADWFVSNALYDADGTLSGRSNSVVVPNHPFNTRNANVCHTEELSPASNASACDATRYPIGTVSINNLTRGASKSVPFNVQRIVPASLERRFVYTPSEVERFFIDANRTHKNVNLINDGSQRYRIDLLDVNGEATGVTRLELSWASASNAPSPTLRLTGTHFGNCGLRTPTGLEIEDVALATLSVVAGIGQLNGTNHSAYFVESDGSLRIRLVPFARVEKVTARTIHQAVVLIECNQ